MYMVTPFLYGICGYPTTIGIIMLNGKVIDTTNKPHSIIQLIVWVGNHQSLKLSE